jgi:hypothetical protein
VESVQQKEKVIACRIWLLGRKHGTPGEKSQKKHTTHRKIAAHQKMGQRSEKKKPVVGVKRRKLGIYET